MRTLFITLLFAAPAFAEAPQVSADLYPTVPISVLAKKDLWIRPRAETTGTVTMVKREADGDVHVRLEGDGTFIVCEFIPELPVSPPKVGDVITIKGVVRYDLKHMWGELHPAVSWKPAVRSEPPQAPPLREEAPVQRGAAAAADYNLEALSRPFLAGTTRDTSAPDAESSTTPSGYSITGTELTGTSAPAATPAGGTTTVQTLTFAADCPPGKG